MQELVDLIFSKEGILSRALKSFEERPEQKEMAQQILKAYLNDEIALIEAGTGTGKSLAYLVPALFWARKQKQRTVISTHTISLQEQLMQKDIPFLLKALDLDLKAALVKGMNNYLCLRKLDELEKFGDEELENLHNWASTTKEGSRSEISFPLSVSSWDKVSSDPHACNHVRCPHYKQCFFFKARKEAQDAQILVVNHHMLLTDLAMKQENEGKEAKSLLPAFERLVLDEAHHFEDIAIECLSKKVDFLGLVRLIMKASPAVSLEFSSSIAARIDIDLPSKRGTIVEQAEKAFQALDRFLAERKKEDKMRVQEDLVQTKGWKEEMAPLFFALAASLKGFCELLFSLDHDTDGKVALLALGEAIENKADILLEFFHEKEGKRLRWIERNPLERGFNVALISAPLEIASHLEKELFSSVASASLCSATLATNQNFDYVRERLGLRTKARVTEKIYTSPFDYAERTLLLVPTDLPEPTHPTFTREAVALLPHLFDASRGSAFVLFTSYEMLRTFYTLLLPFAEERGYPLLRQGEMPRSLILEKFKQKEGSLLFGTDSFWEGVDVAGEALRSVIIVKLPFKVPSDPMVEAQAELLTAQGKNPFLEYAVPQAAIKFKQGFGRLMRQKTDRGCVVCLDNRLITRSYGKTILKSLPPSPTFFDKKDQLIKRMQDFYIEVK